VKRVAGHLASTILHQNFIVDSILSKINACRVQHVDGPHDPWSEFAQMVFKLNGLIMLAGESISGAVGQSSARWQVLGRAIEPRTVADLAREVGYARQSVQRVADVLAREGLIAYRPHPTDRRTKLIELTPSGWRVLKALYERQLEWSERVMAALDAASLVNITANLREVAHAIEAHVDSAGET
jgi:DNA-binding MarR family transcriptional regulator